MFSILEGSFKSFENYTVELLANETKWTSLEVRTHPTFLETLIQKYDSGPVKLPGLSRNGPLDSMLLRQWKKIYPDLASTRFRIHSVFKSFHSGERIKKKVGSSARFTGYVWTEFESAKKRWWDSIIPGYVLTRPETRFTTIDTILNRYSARTLRAREHLEPVYMEVGTPGRGGNPQVE